MAATLVATFTLIRCVRGSLYGDIWNLVRLVRVGEILNCALKVKNPHNLYVVSLRKHGTTVGHILRVISCICTLFFNKASWFHWSTLTGRTAAPVLIPKTWATGRSRWIALTVIYYLVRSFVHFT